MFDADAMLGIKKPNPNVQKEVKVKLPMQQMLTLHFLKMTSNRTFSDIVSDALADYFASLDAAPAPN